jgi:uncharacterized delta-60 repeat protein
MRTRKNSLPAAARINVQRSQHRVASRRARRFTTSRSSAIESLEFRCLLSAGFLDDTFGAHGQVLTALQGSSYSTADSVAMLADGKFLVGAQTSQSGPPVLVRFNANAQIDSTFGTDGFLTFPAGSKIIETVIQSDGRFIVLTGDMYLTRYLPSGELDSSFGTAGKAAAWTGPLDSTCVASDVLLLPDNTMWVAGRSAYPVGSGTDCEFALSNVAANGESVQQYSFDVSQTLAEAEPALARQSDGKVILAGILRAPAYWTNDAAILRVLENGSLDPTFGGGDGNVQLGVGTMSMLSSIALQSGGEIVVAGSMIPSIGSYPDFCFARVTPAGELDATFGTTGFKHFDGGWHLVDNISAIAIDGTDRIIGIGTVTDDSLSDFALIRLTPTGGTDFNFSSMYGSNRTDFGGREDSASDMAFVSGERLLLVGESTTAQGVYPRDTRVAFAQFLMNDLSVAAPRLVYDTGPSNSDGVTNATSLGFSIMGILAGSTVTLFRDGVPVAVGTSPLGMTDEGPVPDGTYQYTIRQVAVDGTMGPTSWPTMVTVDTARPVDLEHSFSFGAPMALRYRWDDRTYVNLADLEVRNQTTGQLIPDGNISGAYDIATNSVTFTFPGFRNGVLPNGNYVATLPGSAVTDLAGNTVFTDSVITFRVLMGDADDNGVVDFDDYVRIDNGFNQHLTGWPNGDFNGSGSVDFDDYVLLDVAFNTQSQLPRIADNVAVDSMVRGDFNGDGRINFGDEVWREIEINARR